MDILTRIKNSEFRKEVIKILQSAKINNKIEGVEIIDEMPISNINDTYFSIICKIVQDIEKHAEIDNTAILRDVVILSLCKNRKGKKFDTYYDEIIADIEKNTKLVSKLLI